MRVGIATFFVWMTCLWLVMPALAEDESDGGAGLSLVEAPVRRTPGDVLFMTDDSPTSIEENTESKPRTPMRFTLGDWYSPKYHGIDNTQGNTIVFRAYVPWEIGGVDQMLRVHVPFETSSPGEASDSDVSDTPAGPNGLGDMEIYDVSLLKNQWGVFSIGPVFTIPTGTKSGVGKGQWTIGPAFGFARKRGDWRMGFFSEGFFSFDGANDTDSVEKLKVQPILELSLPHGWVVGTSDMNFTYDWVKGKFTNIPLGLTVGRALEWRGQKVKVIGETEYNFASATGTSAWTFRLTLEWWQR